ncbi:MAG: PAS domain S-box protein [Thermoplasmata archaeon]
MGDDGYLRFIAENCQEIIFVTDLNGIIEYVSPSVRIALGYEPSGLIGKEFASLIHPKCFETMERALDSAMKEQRSVRLERLRILHSDGNWKVIEGSARGCLDESGRIVLVLSILDISEQLEKNRALDEKAKYFDMLTETTKDMIFVLDENLIVRFVNKYAASIFDKTPEALVGKRMEALFPAHIAEAQKKNVERVLNRGELLNVEAETIFPRGRAWIDTWLIPIKDENGNVVRVLGMSRDITHKKEATVQLEQRTQQAEDAKNRAQEYFDYLAHDIANLVAPIMTYAEAISQREDTSQEAKKYSARIIEQVKEIATFLLNLRTLSEVQKIDASGVESLNLAECLTEIVSSIESHYPNRKFRLHYEKPTYDEVFAVGGKYVRNMLAVELDRAARYAHNQDIDVHISISPIIDEAGQEFWQLKLEIPDLTLPSKFREMLSTPFNLSGTRTERRRTSRNLSFLASVVEHFGGKLWFEDASPGQPEKGFSMKIRLPKSYLRPSP